MSRKQPKRRAGIVAKLATAGFFILAIACGVGFGVASADSSDDLARAGAFGFDEATHAATLQNEGERSAVPEESAAVSARSLGQAPSRDISNGLKMVESHEEERKERAQEENSAAQKRVEGQKAMQGVTAKPQESTANQTADQKKSTPEKVIEYDLPKVDWSVGRDEFISMWTERIDAYLEGSNLAGYGAVFAEAAWENGVDPRWSPAISNTESSKGSKCFLSHNAWGWGDNTWSDWSTAIRDHVKGLAEVYGYSVTFAAAQKYCPPNYVNWFNNTFTEMERI